MNWKKVARLVSVCLLLTSASFAEDYSLRYFMEKSLLKTYELPKKERAELLDRVETMLEKSKEIQLSLTRTIQGGETDIKYQEGRFWLSKLEEDQKAIDSGSRQLEVLREKPMHLVGRSDFIRP